MNRYKILSSPDHEELTKDVNALIKEGWSIKGPCQVVQSGTTWFIHQYVQTMVRDD